MQPQDPKWMAIARAELGVRETPGPGDNPRVVEYHQATSLHSKDDETSWCSAFANWVMTQAGIKGTNLANARSWLTWGHPLKEPRRGCIVVLWRGDPKSWQGHVAFYEGGTGSTVRLLGGNQGDAVSYADFPVSRVLGYRWPFPPGA